MLFTAEAAGISREFKQARTAEQDLEASSRVRLVMKTYSIKVVFVGKHPSVDLENKKDIEG